jgi:hypothetical protein
MFQFIKYTFCFLILSSTVFIFQNCGPNSGNLGAQGSYNTFSNDHDGPDIYLVDKPADIAADTHSIFQISATDNGAGVEKREYSLDDAGWVSMGSLLTLNGLSQGNHNIKKM